MVATVCSYLRLSHVVLLLGELEQEPFEVLVNDPHDALLYKYFILQYYNTGGKKGRCDGIKKIPCFS